MIRLQEYTPDVYYERSRDFQFIGRLFDLALNSAKTETSRLQALANDLNFDESLLELLALTLGLKLNSAHYSSRQLNAVCKVFPVMLRKKGSLEAVRILIAALFHAEGIKANYQLEQIDNTIVLHLPPEFTAISLANDLMTYILPAGMSFYIVFETIITVTPNTKFFATDEVFYTDYDPTSEAQTMAFPAAREDVATGFPHVLTLEEIQAGLANKVNRQADASSLYLDDKEIKPYSGYIGGTSLDTSLFLEPKSQEEN